MKIGIIGAMEEEVTLLRDKNRKPPDHHHWRQRIYTGQLHGVDVALLKSGIGESGGGDGRDPAAGALPA